MALKRDEESRKIELIPLIDIVFLLLIFFIVATAIGRGIGRRSSDTIPPIPSDGVIVDGGRVPVPLKLLPFPRVEGGTEASAAGLTIRFRRNQDGRMQMYLFDRGVPDLNALEQLIQDLPSQQLQPRYGPFPMAGQILDNVLRNRLQNRINSIRNQVVGSGRAESFSLQIKADEETPYGLIIDVFSVCRQEQVNLANIWVKKILRPEIEEE